MKLSAKRCSAVYEAISEPIMQKRITVKNSEHILGEKNTRDIDDLLFKLQHDIWTEIKKVLDIAES